MNYVAGNPSSPSEKLSLPSWRGRSSAAECLDRWLEGRHTSPCHHWAHPPSPQYLHLHTHTHTHGTVIKYQQYFNSSEMRHWECTLCSILKAVTEYTDTHNQKLIFNTHTHNNVLGVCKCYLPLVQWNGFNTSIISGYNMHIHVHFNVGEWVCVVVHAVGSSTRATQQAWSYMAMLILAAVREAS